MLIRSLSLAVQSRVQQGANTAPDNALFFISLVDGLKYYLTMTIDGVENYITI